MDDDRKYRQRGYMDSNGGSSDRRLPDRSKPSGPRPPLDVTENDLAFGLAALDRVLTALA